MSQEKIAIVTGASRGIGRALALGLEKEGYVVTAMARSNEDLRLLAASSPSRILPVKLDLKEPHSIAAAVSNVVRKFGKVDLLINNAGMGSVGTLDIPFGTFEELLKVNLSGPFRLLQEVVPLMLERKSGMIINVASRAGKVGFAGFGAYGASKFGLVGLGESLYRELSPRGIKVTTLCPSWVDTTMARESGTPLEREEMIQPEDLMMTVRWLLSLSPSACVREVMIECRGNISS